MQTENVTDWLNWFEVNLVSYLPVPSWRSDSQKKSALFPSRVNEKEGGRETDPPLHPCEKWKCHCQCQCQCQCQCPTILQIYSSAFPYHFRTPTRLFWRNGGLTDEAGPSQKNDILRRFILPFWLISRSSQSVSLYLGKDVLRSQNAGPKVRKSILLLLLLLLLPVCFSET